MTPEESFRQHKLRQFVVTPEYQMWKDQYDTEEKAAREYHDSFMRGLQIRAESSIVLAESLKFTREEDIRFQNAVRRWVILGLVSLAALYFLYRVLKTH